MGMLGQHGDSTAKGMTDSMEKAQHGDSTGMLGQHGDSMGCQVSIETALRKDNRKEEPSFSEENGKKKRREGLQTLVCLLCALLCSTAAGTLFYYLFFLRYYPIFLCRLSLSRQTRTCYTSFATTTTTGRLR